MGLIPEKVVFVPFRLRNQKWDTYHFSGAQLWLRLAARVHPWRSAGARRGQDAGSALLRNDAVHTVLPGPRAVSCLVFFAQSARSCRFTLGWRWRAAQSENQLDTGRFAMKGMHSMRH